MEKKKLIWSKHFEERLLERFAIKLDSELKELIDDYITTNEPFAKLSKRKGCSEDTDGEVYAIRIRDSEVMVLTAPAKGGTSKSKLRIISAFRKSWFNISADGSYYYTVNETTARRKKKNAIKFKKRYLRNGRHVKQNSKQYKKDKEASLSDCDYEASFVK